MLVFVGVAVALAAVLLFWPVRMRIGFSCAMDAFALRIAVGPFVLYRVELPEQGGAPTEVPKPPPVEATPARPSDTGKPQAMDSAVESTPAERPAPLPNSPQAPRSEPVRTDSPPSGADSERRLLQALLTPGMESQLLKSTLASGRRFLRIFQLRIQDLEVNGSFASPYWNGIWVGLAGAGANLLPGLENARFVPDWEGRDGWRCHGILRFSLNGWRILAFLILTLASFAWLAWSVWRRYRRTLADPLARELPEARRWILNKISPPHEKG